MAGRKVRATFTIDAELKARLDRTIPASKRSEFVEESLLATLDRANREAFLGFLQTLPQGSPEAGDSTEYLREKRLEWDGRPRDTLEGNGQ